MFRSLILLLCLLVAVAQAAPVIPQTVILGDSIARDDICADVVAGPSEYLAPATNLAVDGNTIYQVTKVIRQHLRAKRAWVHVGVNDVMLDSQNAENDLAGLLSIMGKRPDIYFVVDELGPIAPSYYNANREALRLRMNAQLRANSATNVLIIPYAVTNTCDGIHPNDLGYAQQMPLVLTAFALGANQP